MTKVIFDKETLKRMPDMKEKITICDESGKILGHFIPATITSPNTEEELDEFEKELSGRPLAEILRDLEKLGRSQFGNTEGIAHGTKRVP
jgi:hypothetical protein